MTRRVFLHIGLPKTGTTYLQDCLWSNRAGLIERGVLLPGGRRRHLLASFDFCESPSLARRPGNVAHPWQDLVDEVRTFDGDAVISHEFFASATEAQVPKAIEAFPDAEVHVIVTARPMVDLFISRWQEYVKNGARRSIDDYPPPRTPSETWEWGWPSFDLASVLERWGSAVPHERIHVLPVAPGRGDPTALWVRFLDVLGLDVAGLDGPEKPANPTMGLVEVELLRRVNEHMPPARPAQDRVYWTRRYLGEGKLLSEQPERFRPDDAKLADLVARGERAVAMLRDGAYDLRGDLQDLQPTDVSGRRHPAQLSSDELLESAVRLVGAVVDDLRSASEPPHAAPAAPAASPPRRSWKSVRRVLASRRIRLTKGLGR